MAADLALDTVYREARTRIAELAGKLTEDELSMPVPACPEWTIRDLLGHVSGVAADIVAGRVEGAPGPQWTAAQVARAKGRPVPDLMAEWAQAGPQVEARLAARSVSHKMVFDVVTHEGDLRECLGRQPADGWQPVLTLLARQIVRNPRGTLVLHIGDETYRGGDGEPVTELRVDPYELLRGIASRRSRAQMRSWDWTGDPTPYVETLPIFGPRDDDQPIIKS